jgi:hypothetical protein
LSKLWPPPNFNKGRDIVEESRCLIEMAGAGKGVSAEGAVSRPTVVVEVSGRVG